MSLSDLSSERVRALLRTRCYGHSLRLLESTDSTNDDAKRDAAVRAPDGHTVIADRQQSGRGSHGRSWSSPAGDDLYVSIVDRPRIVFAALPPLTLAVGLGVADAVERLVGPGTRTQVKWPNDVWLDGKKCAGILIEASSRGAELESVVIGVGLNVNRSVFPVELTGNATSLRLSRPARLPFDRAVVLCEVLHAIETWVDRFTSAGPSELARALDARLAMRGERARCGDIEGIVRGVSPSGALRLETRDGLRELISGRLLPVGAI